MPTTAESLQPYIVNDWRNAAFATGWTLGGRWATTPFDTLPRGEASALWHHTAGTGRYPFHTGYDYTGAASQSLAESPSIDLTPFVNPDGSGDRNGDFWTVFVRLWFRVNRNLPTLAAVEQQRDRLYLVADNGVDPAFEVGLFSNWDTADVPPDFNPDPAAEGAIELSRISPTIPGEFASDVLTVTVNPTQNETVVLGSKTYRFRENLSGDTANDVEIGVNLAASLVNLAAAINGTPGRYASTTTANADAGAVSDATTLTATALALGTAGNSIAATEALANGSWASATLLGGVDDATDPNVGDNGQWWFEQLLAPNADQQALLLGNNVTFSLRCDVAESDSTDYGIGVVRFSVEILRSGVSEIAALRGGFAGVPATLEDFPVSLYKSWANSRRWR